MIHLCGAAAPGSARLRGGGARALKDDARRVPRHRRDGNDVALCHATWPSVPEKKNTLEASSAGCTAPQAPPDLSFFTPASTFRSPTSPPPRVPNATSPTTRRASRLLLLLDDGHERGDLLSLDLRVHHLGTRLVGLAVLRGASKKGRERGRHRRGGRRTARGQRRRRVRERAARRFVAPSDFQVDRRGRARSPRTKDGRSAGRRVGVAGGQTRVSLVRGSGFWSLVGGRGLVYVWIKK